MSLSPHNSLADERVCLEEKVAHLMSQLSHTSREVRVEAAVALIRIGDEPMFKDLLLALRHTEPRVVVGAALTLGRIGDRRAVQGLIQAFKTDDQNVGAAVAWALGRCKDTQALPWLMLAIEQGFVVAHACEALGQIGDARALEPLVLAAASTMEDAKAYALRAIGMLNFALCSHLVPDVIGLLRSHLQDPSRKVRLCVALSLHALSQKK